MSKTRLSIQNVLLPDTEPQSAYWDLYYQGAEIVCEPLEKGSRLLLGHYKDYNFCSYFNAISTEKWKRYTRLEKLYLCLDMEGDFEIAVEGYHLVAESAQRKTYARKRFKNAERKTVEMEIPLDNEEILFGFSVKTYSDCKLYGGTYDAEIEEAAIRDVKIAISTTTFKKEDYIRTNVEMIKKELIADEEIGSHWFLHVVDNGRTLERTEIEGKQVYYHPNKNVGGSGGFARGMIEVLNQETPATHILLMDDDVLVFAESLKRTYYLLSMMKEEYYQHVISGAMLQMEEMDMFWEDAAYIAEGINRSIKVPRKMKHISDLLINENLNTEIYLGYAAWWYCCIPIETVKKSGLPLPVFVRGDDIEYGVRNKIKTITMNGISLWHMGFATKYSFFSNCYQAFRNLLILNACNNCGIADEIVAHFEDRIVIEIHRFNYNAVKLILDAWSDYMKGPKFLEVEQCEKILKEKSSYNAKMKDLKEFDVQVNLADVYEADDTNYIQRVFYRLTKNGQRFWPGRWMDDKAAVISFDEFYNPQRETFHRNLLAVDIYSQTGEMRSLDKKKYKVLMARYKKIKKRYQNKRDKIEAEYRKEQPYLVSREFWNKYLEIEKYQ